MATILRATKNANHLNSKHKQNAVADDIEKSEETKSDSIEISPTSHQTSEEEIEIIQRLEWPKQHVTEQELEEHGKFCYKLKALQYALEADLMACDAKWTLFVSAAFSYRYDSVLQPCPPQFATDTLGYDIDSLMSVINDTPKLSIVLQNLMEQSWSAPSSDVIDLLYWVLIEMGEPALRVLEAEEVDSLLHSIQPKTIKIKPTHVFEVKGLSGFHSDLEFTSRTSGLPLRLAFMGNKLDNYFSILQNGFRQLPENTNNFKLTTDLQTSFEHSPYFAAWGASQCGSIISCIAICEYALNEAEDNITLNKNDKSCVDIHLCNSQNIRVRYIIFCGRRFPRKRLTKGGLLSWFYNKNFSFSLLSYTLLLVSIGLVGSNRGEIFKTYVYKKFWHILDLCRQIITKESSQ